MRVKVCGLTRKEDVELCCLLGVDALGFVLAESPRQISIERIASLIENIPPFLSTVAVVSNPEYRLLKKILRSGLFDYIQFHGNEPAELINDFPLKTIKAISIGPAMGIEEINEKLLKYNSADFFLFDSRVANLKGGTGESFQWDILEMISIKKPYILAGGLGRGNIKSAIFKIRMTGVDINSKVESSAGIKDRDLLIEIIRIINNCRKELIVEDS